MAIFKENILTETQCMLKQAMKADLFSDRNFSTKF